MKSQQLLGRPTMADSSGCEFSIVLNTVLVTGQYKGVEVRDKETERRLDANHNCERKWRVTGDKEEGGYPLW